MSGCDYMNPKFSIACNSGKIEQMQWDLAFMKPEEFMVAYKLSAKDYDILVNGKIVKSKE